MARSGGDQPHGQLGQAIFSPADWNALLTALNLSPRELEIVRFVFDDEKETSIAGELGISSHTVHTHLGRLYRKIGVRSRGELMVRIFSEYLALRAVGHDC